MKFGSLIKRTRKDSPDEAPEESAAESATGEPTRSEPDPFRDPPADPDPADYPDLPRHGRLFVLKRTLREFLDDGCTDLAASLTYYSVLAIFPGLLALLSLVGVVGQAQQSVEKILTVLRPLVSPDFLDQLRGPLEDLAASDAAGLTLIIGLAGALWSASGYVGAFSRAMNRIYEVEEGRPFWRMRPMQLGVTLATVLLSAVALVILIVSGPVAEGVGDAIGLGDDLLLVWNILKWPLLAGVVMAVVALLYYATPNVSFPRFRPISAGAFVAIMIWLAASVGFAFYVANFGSYNKTYGSVAGVVVALLWLWLTNVALLFGAELDAELARSRQLGLGIAAEERLQLPVRDTRNIVKNTGRRAQDLATQRSIRMAAGSGDPEDRPFGRP